MYLWAPVDILGLQMLALSGELLVLNFGEL